MTASRILAPNGRPARVNGHVRARYDAAWTSTWRSYAPQAVQSAAKDVAADRQTLMGLARRWDQNSPLIHGLLERLTTNCIGTGLNPVPASSSARWNSQITKKWSDWARRPEITDRFSWGTCQRILWRSALRDGDCFALLTTRSEEEDGAPCIQLIEGHRIKEPTAPSATPEGDGVIRDANGKHVGYKLVGENGLLERPPLSGAAVIQVLLPERPDQPRGITLFASALKTIHNLDDILRLESLAVKDASGKTDVVTTASGEMPVEDVATFDGTDIPPIKQDAVGYYHEVFGPEAKILQNGDTYTPYEPKRPGPAWNGFVDYLSSTIALTTGLPPSVLLPGKLGGADTRKDLAAAARTFEVWQFAIADALQKVYEFVVGTWLDTGAIGNAPKDWRRTNWQMPRSVTADAGRIAQADLDLVAAGLLSVEDYFGEQGWIGREKLEQIAAEQDLVDELDPSGRLAARLYSKPGAAAAPQPTPDEQNAQDNQPDGAPSGTDQGDGGVDPTAND